MSRFRIFDKQEKKYVSEFLTQYYLNHDGKLFFVFAGEGKYNEIHKELDPDRYIVEFSTGLKDKNGKEIYEGDVLEGCNGSINGYGMKDKWIVQWNKARAEFSIPLWAYDNDGEYTRDDSTHWFEITGNIHDGETDDKI